MSEVIQAARCIRCLSTTHTTREHDEGKIDQGKKKAPPTQVKKQSQPSPASLKVGHPKCWANPTRSDGIPDIIDPPVPDRFYRDPPREKWHERSPCPCDSCCPGARKKN